MTIRDCCRNEDNLEVIDSRPNERTSNGAPVSFTTRQCKVCGAKHHRLVAAPAAMGVRGAPMGTTAGA